MRRVLAVVPDLFFSAKIAAVAKAAGATLALVPPGQARARCAAETPDLLLIDLHAGGDPMALVRTLKSDPLTRGVRVVGFYSHVEHAVRKAAIEAGVDDVLPRSAFVARLPELLAGGGDPRADRT